MNKQPEKTAKTRQHIMDSFRYLANRDGISKVSVSAVARQAEINRGTFYVYFLDLDDLISRVEEEMIHSFQANVKKQIYENSTIDRTSVISGFVNLIGQYDDLFFQILQHRPDSELLKIILKEGQGMIESLFPVRTEDDNLDYRIVYAASAVIGTLRHWHETGRRISTDELAKILYSLSVNGVYASITGLKIDKDQPPALSESLNPGT